MDKKIYISKKTFFTMISLIVFLVMALAFSLAWFTDIKIFNNPVNMGVVEIDTSSGEGSQSALTKTIVRSVGDYTEGGKVMPGDTINFNFRIKLTSNSEPSYYLIKIQGTGLLTSLNTNNLYYINSNDEKVEISNSATGDDRTCGIITVSDVKNLTFSYTIPLSYEIPNITGKAFCTIAAIQQSNITIKDAYDILNNKLNPIYYNCDEDGTFNPAGDFIAFGSYPQSLKESSVTIVDESVTDTNGYYTGDDNEKYVRYNSNYYKVEPIVWQILKTEGSKAMLMTNSIIEKTAYLLASNISGSLLKAGVTSYDGETSDGTEPANNYKFSQLRTWLNTAFYNNFSDEEKAIMQTTDVNNSKATTNSGTNPYAPDYEILRDKVFALSYQEYSNSNLFVDNTSRNKQRSDYVIATGGTLNSYWSRSPHSDRTDWVFTIADGLLSYNDPSRGWLGVCPAIVITL